MTNSGIQARTETKTDSGQMLNDVTTPREALLTSETPSDDRNNFTCQEKSLTKCPRTENGSSIKTDVSSMSVESTSLPDDVTLEKFIGNDGLLSHSTTPVARVDNNTTEDVSPGDTWNSPPPESVEDATDAAFTNSVENGSSASVIPLGGDDGETTQLPTRNPDKGTSEPLIRTDSVREVIASPSLESQEETTEVTITDLKGPTTAASPAGETCPLKVDHGFKGIDLTVCTEQDDLFINATTAGEGGGVRVATTSCCVYNCTHKVVILAPEGSQILLNFTELYIMGTYELRTDKLKNCQAERLTVALMREGEKVVVRELCGLVNPERVLTLDHHHVMLTMEVFDNVECGTNLMGDYVSYEVEYRVCDAPPAPDPMEECQKLHQRPSWQASMNLVDSTNNYLANHRFQTAGRITSPGYLEGENYPEFSDCHWEIKAPVNQRIELSFRHLSLELDPQPGMPAADCDRDYVTISTHTNPANHTTPATQQFPARMTFCGKLLPRTFVSPTERLTVEFRSNEAIGARGFDLSYRFVKSSLFVPYASRGLLNCSTGVPDYVKCDIALDCHGGEDEAEELCPRVSECERKGGWADYRGGRVSSCYWTHVMGDTKVAMTWLEAEDFCQSKHRGYLVSFNTRQEIRTLERYLVARHPGLTPEQNLYIGLRRMKSSGGSVYRRLWQWSDGTTAFDHLDEIYSSRSDVCGIWSRLSTLDTVRGVECAGKRAQAFICEVSTVSQVQGPSVTWPNVSWEEKKSTFQCASGERVDMTLQCNGWSDCRDSTDEDGCDLLSLLSVFYCSTGIRLPFSQVCDGVDNCLDGSDETFCTQTNRIISPANMTQCRDGYLIPETNLCDGREHCIDGSDESGCELCSGSSQLCPTVGCIPEHWTRSPDVDVDCPMKDDLSRPYVDEEVEEGQRRSVQPPAVVYPDGWGKADIRPLDQNETCPQTHLECPDGFCIPVSMLCNGFTDCPEGQDESDDLCDSGCPNMYKCRGSRMCLHSSQVCDGHPDCPDHDDEMLCPEELACPHNCTCVRHEYKCQGLPPVDEKYYRLRSLDLSGLDLSATDLDPLHSYNLIFLNLSMSNMTRLEPERLSLVNLITLDLSMNKLRELADAAFSQTRRLRHLHLQHNTFLGTDNYMFLQALTDLQYLDLSYNDKVTLTQGMFTPLDKLVELRMSYMGIVYVRTGAFSGLASLKRLDLRGNLFSDFPRDVLTPLSQVDTLLADNYKLCCAAVAPKALYAGACLAPDIPITDCQDLLGSIALQVSTWILSVLAVIGNTVVLVTRLVTKPPAASVCPGRSLMVTALTVPNLLMGVYLAVIASAHVYYQGSYLWHESEWRNSGLCSLAGFLYMTSVQFSIWLAGLMTLDRLAVTIFPLKDRAHFSVMFARRAIGCVVVLALALSVTLLISSLEDMGEGQPTAVCVPMVLSSTGPYFAIFVVVSSVLILLVVSGYLGIALYAWAGQDDEDWFVDAADMRTTKCNAVLMVVLSTVWLLVGISALLDAAGVHLAGTLDELLTLALIPSHAALYPLLYAISAKLQARQSKQPINKTKIVAGRQSLMTSEPMTKLMSWLNDRSVTPEVLEDLLKQRQGKEDIE